MKKILIAIAASVLVLSFPSCNKARLKGIDDKISDLEKEDSRILQELSDAIDELEKTLLGKIAESNEKLNHDIDAAVMKMMDYLSDKMKENQEYLETELAMRREECDQTISKLRAKAEDVKGGLDDALDITQARLQKAIADGDEDIRQKLLLVEENIGRAYDYIDFAEKSMSDWDKTIAKFEATGMYDNMDNLSETMKALTSFDIQDEVDKVEENAKTFARIKLDQLSEDKLNELHTLMSDMDSWVDDAVGYADDCESKSQEMADLLDDWRDRADDLYGSIDDLKESITDGFESIISEYQGYSGDLDSMVDDVTSNAAELELLIGEIIADGDLIQGMAAELENRVDDVETEVDMVFTLADDLRSESGHLEDRMGDMKSWCDANPWVYEK